MRFKRAERPIDGRAYLHTAFLWFPKTLFFWDGIRNRETRWLETATWARRWNRGTPLTGGWTDLYWLDAPESQDNHDHAESY